MKTEKEIKRQKADYQLRRQHDKTKPYHDRDLAQRKVNRQSQQRGNPFKPIPPLHPLDELYLWSLLSKEEQDFIIAHPNNFLKEHTKYLEFLTFYRNMWRVSNADKIVYIGAGALLEKTDMGHWDKNEILALIERWQERKDNYLNKLWILGLKGNDTDEIFDKSKEIKYEWLLRLNIIPKERIIRCFVTPDSYYLIPQTNKLIHFIVMVDAKKELINKSILISLKKTFPNYIIDFIVVSRIKKDWEDDIKIGYGYWECIKYVPITQFKSHNHPCLHFIRIKSSNVK